MDSALESLKGHKVMKINIIAAIPVLAVLFGGCASLINSTYQSVSVLTLEQNGSELTGAVCELTNNKGKWFVTTPGSLMISRSGDDLQVICSKPGSNAGKAVVVSDTMAPMYGNIVVGGGVGAVVDHNNGSAYEYPTVVRVAMGSFSKIESSKVAEKKGWTRADSSANAMSSTLAAGNMAAGANKTSGRAELDPSDPCGTYLAVGEKCWWSPPGAPSNGICPTVPSLKQCTKYYGAGCRIGHGKSLPGC